MFLILGLTWITDIIAWGLKPYEQTSILDHIFGYWSLVINSLQGVILFCVVFSNSAIVKRIRQSFGKTNNRPRFGMQTSSGTANSTNVTYHTNSLQPENRIRAVGVTKIKDEVQV